MVVIALWLVFLAVAMVILRMIMGPTIYDRILSMNLLGTLVVVVLALFSWMRNDYMYLDIALTYGLMNFITTIAILRYFRHGSFARGSEDKE